MVNRNNYHAIERNRKMGAQSQLVIYETDLDQASAGNSELINNGNQVKENPKSK